MILLDFSGVCMGTMLSQNKNQKLDEGLIRHMILNTLRMYNMKFKDKYGKLIVVCDGGSWRRDVYPEYKASRRKNREEGTSGHDWTEVFRIMNLVREEIIEFMPYEVLQFDNVEADDIIATLVESTQEFGQHDNVMIVSADKDFIQLQRYDNVKQFSPMTKKLVSDKNPITYLFEHILKGDSSDGVPNVLSADDVFTSGGRQTPLTAKRIAEWSLAKNTLAETMPSEVYRNFVRNRQLIDLEYIPEKIKKMINDGHNAMAPKNNAKVLNYLISKRCNLLIGCAAEFFS
jgi:hypothetical protein